VIRGVNLGGWLVLEKWITPALFAGTSAEDEAQLWTELSDRGQRELLSAHRDAYITERDFADLASRRIDAVRIPVPYFVFGDHQPYTHEQLAFDPDAQAIFSVIDTNGDGVICFKPYPNGDHNGHLGNLVDDKAAPHA